MTRVLITNAYSARNRGDAAIVLGMIESLRRTDIFGDARFLVSSTDHPADGARYPVDTAPSFHSLKNRVPGGPGLGSLYFLAVLLPVSLAWAAAWRLTRVDVPLPRRLRGLMRAYAEADVVVAAGGGYLYTTAALRGNVVLAINLYCFVFAALLGKPVALYAQSIGPFAARWQAWLVRLALAGVMLVEVREHVSQRLLESWGPPAPVLQAVDAAFLLEARPPAGGAGILAPGDGLNVGVTVRRWFRDREHQAAYERTVASFVDWLSRERGASVVFLPQVTYAEGGDDDRETARRVVDLLGERDRIRVVEDDLEAAEVKWLCSRMDVVVGTRMHSNIFALSSGVPAVAIAYQPKTAGMMSQLGMGDYVVSIEGLGLEELQQTFDAVLERGAAIREGLRSALQGLEARAADGGRFIAEAYAEWRRCHSVSGEAG